MISRKVWTLGYDGFAVLPTIDQRGKRTLYGIVLSLDRVSGLPVHLHMRVKSAHPRDGRHIDTVGEVEFARLVTLRMRRKRSNRITGANRKRPRVT